MNIEKERELFLCELGGHGYEFYNKTWIHGLGDVGNRFDDDQLNMVWEMWLASRNRGGFVLVPVNPTKEMVTVGDREHKGYDYVDSESIYKAMIGVCDD